ncbi:MAG: hypothetical protein ACLP75_22840 [Mycobacterium sp.]|uniref:hypothetical protein n=1 Tax=Mycobacterium sp. TaxID=1785 RepID=UPI003F999EEA
MDVRDRGYEFEEPMDEGFGFDEDPMMSPMDDYGVNTPRPPGQYRDPHGSGDQSYRTSTEGA